MTASPESIGYALLHHLDEHQPVPTDGILTRKLYEADHVKAVLFTFAPGQELSEHTASMPAMLYFIRGEADVTLNDDRISAAPGSFIHMDAHLKHAIRAKTDVTMLLILFRSAKS